MTDTESVHCWKIVKEDEYVLGTPYFNSYPDLVESSHNTEIRILGWEVLQ